MVAYLEQVELFYKANRVRDNSKVAVFLTVIGASNYALLQKLLAPEKPVNKSLDELMGRQFEAITRLRSCSWQRDLNSTKSPP